MKFLTTISLLSLFYWTPVIAEPKPAERVEAVVTAYTSLPELTDSTPFTMANGEEVHYGAMACPRKYAFGTVVIGLGIEMICEDRMNRRYTDDMNHFDVWLPTLKDAKEFGKYKVILYIYE